MQEIRVVRLSDQKVIELRLPSNETLTLENITKYIDFETACKLTPGLYVLPKEFEHNLKLKSKDIEMMLSNGHKAKMAELNNELERIEKLKKEAVWKLKDQENAYYMARTNRGIPIKREALRNKIVALEKELEDIRKEYNNKKKN